MTNEEWGVTINILIFYLKSKKKVEIIDFFGEEFIFFPFDGGWIVWNATEIIRGI